MKNIFICILFAALLALTASAGVSYFYWGVDTKSNYTFNYATIKAVSSTSSDSGYLSLYGAGDTTSVGTKLYANQDLTTGTTAGNIFAGFSADTYGSGSKFLVELWTTSSTANEAATLVAWQSVDFSTVSSNKSIYSDMSQSGNNAYTFSNFVPEPTGGLLVLLGTAALALRRKQKVA